MIDWQITNESFEDIHLSIDLVVRVGKFFGISTGMTWQNNILIPYSKISMKRM